MKTPTQRVPSMSHVVVTRTVLAPLCAAFALGGCTKLLDVDLQIAEPCGQDNQALNGVASYLVTSTGSDADDAVAFNVDQGGQPLQVGLGERVVVTVKGFVDDITQGDAPTEPTAAPKSVGRTMPLSVASETGSIRAQVLVGKVDSFGGPRDLDGSCTSMTDGASVPGRHGHTATYIPAVGKVLLFGGAVWTTDATSGQPVEAFLTSAELFDPSTGTFTELPELANSRAYHTATALPDGRVLIAGGLGIIGSASAGAAVVALVNGVVVDVRPGHEEAPYTNILLREQRAHHTATLLADANLVALVGGCKGNSAADGCTATGAAGQSTNLNTSVEVIDLDKLGNGTSVSAPGEALQVPRAFHQALAFNTGSTSIVIVSGGVNGLAGPTTNGTVCSLEVLQVDGSSLKNITATANLRGLPTGKCPVRHQMVALDAARFAIVGGQTTANGGVLSDTAPGSADVFLCNKVAGDGCESAATSSLLAPRWGHAAARLQDGSVVVIGGSSPSGTATSEVLKPGTGAALLTASATSGALSVARVDAAMTMLGGDSPDEGFVNQVLYSGGHSTTAPYATSKSVDIYFGN